MSNLFSANEVKQIKEQFRDSFGLWLDVFSDNFFIKVNQALEKVRKKAHINKTTPIYPVYDDLFKAFKLTNPKDIRVVIVGQDPYHNGNANGLAFGCKESVSPSLKQIGKAMQLDLGKVERHPNSSKSLEYLAEQGVLLLNTSLTVEKGVPNSHKHIWHNGWFDEVVKAVNHNNDYTMWLLWGSEAKKMKGNYNMMYSLESSHPVSANYKGQQWRVDHFSKTNAFIERFLGSDKIIKWL